MGLRRHKGEIEDEDDSLNELGEDYTEEETMYLDPEVLIMTREIGADEEKKELMTTLMAIDDEENDEVEVDSILTLRALFVAED